MNREIRAMLLMKRADIETVNASLYVTENYYNPEAVFEHTESASNYLDEAEKLLDELAKEQDNETILL